MKAKKKVKAVGMLSGTIGSALKREEELTTIAELKRQGHSNSTIAQLRNCSIWKIAADLRIIYKRYEEKQLQSKAAMVQEQLDKLADVRRNAWEAWELSRGIFRKSVNEYALGKSGNADDGTLEESLRKIRTIITKEGRLPENAYLSTILRTFEAERQLLGLDAPKAQEAVRVDVFDWKALLSGALASNPAQPKAIEQQQQPNSDIVIEGSKQAFAVALPGTTLPAPLQPESK